MADYRNNVPGSMRHSLLQKLFSIIFRSNVFNILDASSGYHTKGVTGRSQRNIRKNSLQEQYILLKKY